MVVHRTRKFLLRGILMFLKNWNHCSFNCCLICSLNSIWDIHAFKILNAFVMSLRLFQMSQERSLSILQNLKAILAFQVLGLRANRFEMVSIFLTYNLPFCWFLLIFFKTLLLSFLSQIWMSLLLSWFFHLLPKF